MDEKLKIRRNLIKASMIFAVLGAVSAVALVAGGGAFKANAENGSSPKIGKAAPAFSGVSSDGEVISLGQFAGKRVILEWTNHGCPFVKKHYEGGNMQATQKVARGDEDTVWISVISSAEGKQGYVSGREANELTIARKAYPDYVLLDAKGEIGRAYDAKTTPHMFVIDENSVLQYNGAMDDKPSANLASLEGAKNYTLAALDAVKAGQKPDPAQTKPYGCSVKY